MQKASPQSMDDSGLVSERWPPASGGGRKLRGARPRAAKNSRTRGRAPRSQARPPRAHVAGAIVREIPTSVCRHWLRAKAAACAHKDAGGQGSDLRQQRRRRQEVGRARARTETRKGDCTRARAGGRALTGAKDIARNIRTGLAAAGLGEYVVVVIALSPRAEPQRKRKQGHASTHAARKARPRRSWWVEMSSREIR